MTLTENTQLKRIVQDLEIFFFFRFFFYGGITAANIPSINFDCCPRNKNMNKITCHQWKMMRGVTSLNFVALYSTEGSLVEAFAQV